MRILPLTAAIEKQLLRAREPLEDELKRLGVRTYSSAGNFLLANFGPDGPELFRKLENQGILLRERSKDMAEGFVRIAVGTKSEMERLMKQIKRSR